MQTKNIQPRNNALVTKVNAALVISLRILLRLFTPVIDLLINIPLMNAVWRERRELELLTDAHISDIGLNPDCVRQESKRSFFDIPLNRKRSWRRSESMYSVQPF